MAKLKTFEKLQEQVKRYSKDELELSSDNLPSEVTVEDLYGTPVTFTAQEWAAVSMSRKLYARYESGDYPKYTVRLYDTLKRWVMDHNKDSYSIVN
tara:strand:+ start:253 stop:540 length:288 start_codon:yes stop_codon:yes gene_type:complete